MTRTIWLLIWVNVFLLLGLALRLTSPQAAQAQLRARASDYDMIPGQVIGSPTSFVYILDTAQGRLSAVTYDDSSGRTFALPPIDLTQVFQAAQAPAPGARRGY
jgi:hypothetical protein